MSMGAIVLDREGAGCDAGCDALGLYKWAIRTSCEDDGTASGQRGLLLGVHVTSDGFLSNDVFWCQKQMSSARCHDDVFSPTQSDLILVC